MFSLSRGREQEVLGLCLAFSGAPRFVWVGFNGGATCGQVWVLPNHACFDVLLLASILSRLFNVLTLVLLRSERGMPSLSRGSPCSHGGKRDVVTKRNTVFPNLEGTLQFIYF